MNLKDSDHERLRLRPTRIALDPSNKILPSSFHPSMLIPSSITQILLRKADPNVLDLSHFSIPSPPKTDSPALLCSFPNAKLFSNLASMVGEGHIVFLQSLPMPSSKEVENLEVKLDKYSSAVIDSEKNNSIWSILYHHNSLDI